MHKNNGQKHYHNIDGTNNLTRNILSLLSERIYKNIDEIAFLETQGGKPITQAKEDILASIDVFKYYADEATTLSGEKRNNTYTIKEPIGTCGIITSFNYPFCNSILIVILAWKVAPALAAGNTIVLKPSEHTPLSTLFFAHLTTEIGLPKGVLNVVLGGKDVGEALVSSSKIKMVSFTGSTNVGRSISVECAKRFVPCVIELGGKNAAVIFGDVDLEETAKIIVDGAFCKGILISKYGPKLLCDISIIYSRFYS
jgi:acyl-CoA reductase-like NAD-dependent aldehyde dehydrogenase